MPSRTMLYNIADEVWDHEILDLFNIRESILPTYNLIKMTLEQFIQIILELRYPIGGVIGDQQSASLGQLCVKKGMIKATYGTGCFVLINTDENKTKSKNKLLTTIASKVDDKKQYAC
jgi:glycerol kinase